MITNETRGSLNNLADQRLKYFKLVTPKSVILPNIQAKKLHVKSLLGNSVLLTHESGSTVLKLLLDVLALFPSLVTIWIRMVLVLAQTTILFFIWSGLCLKWLLR